MLEACEPGRVLLTTRYELRLITARNVGLHKIPCSHVGCFRGALVECRMTQKLYRRKLFPAEKVGSFNIGADSARPPSGHFGGGVETTISGMNHAEPALQATSSFGTQHCGVFLREVCINRQYSFERHPQAVPLKCPLGCPTETSSA